MREGWRHAWARLQQAREERWYVRWGYELVWVVGILGAVGLWQTRSHLRGDAPAFEVPLLSGGSVSSAALQGKPTMLVFWAPWCTVCKQETPNIESAASLLGDRARVVSVASDYASLDSVEAYVAEHAVTVPVALGGDALARQFRVGAFPTVYFLDDKGVIKGSVVGYTTTAGLVGRTLQ